MRETTNPQHIRVLELPACRMACSGFAREDEPFLPGGTLMRFHDWWVERDRERVDRWFARDFMRYDREAQALMWYYALPDDAELDGLVYEVVDFPGGLYAAAVAIDSDTEDEQRAFDDVREWVRQHTAFVLDGRPGHYDLRHVVTPKRVEEAVGHAQVEIYVPIRLRMPPSRPSYQGA